MTSLGVAGGIGSGKSAFVARLATHPGVRVLHADDEARRLMVEDDALREALAARFGPDTFAPDGSLDRARLAARVFADTPDTAADLAALNALVHPHVRRALAEALAAAQADGVRLFVYEAALLFEVGADALLDATVLVDAPPEVRLARAAARDGAPPEAIRDRMRRQRDPAEARARATFVVENTGSLADLHAAADALAARLLGADASDDRA